MRDAHAAQPASDWPVGTPSSESSAQNSPVQDAEACRLAALHRYDVLDTKPEETFDRITRLAKLVMNTPIVAISLIDRDRQFFKSRIGLETNQTARDGSFCTQAIKSDLPLIVPDARTNALFHNSPLVTGAPHIRFYLGIPLRTFDNQNIGTLCAIDHAPRHPNAEQVSVMQDLASLVVDELELRHLADTDSLTGVLTRRSFMREGARAVAQAQRHDSNVACISIDIDHFKMINDTYGHPIGDRVLRQMAATTQSCLRSMDVFGRLGGEEFTIILPQANMADAIATAERIRQTLIGLQIPSPTGSIGLTASFGVSCLDGRTVGIDTLLMESDAALYRAKSGGRNRVEVVQAGFRTGRGNGCFDLPARMPRH